MDRVVNFDSHIALRNQFLINKLYIKIHIVLKMKFESIYKFAEINFLKNMNYNT